MRNQFKLVSSIIGIVFLINSIHGQERRLSFNPSIHGFHFANKFVSSGPINTAGLCGGMVLAAFNHYRFGIPVPQYNDTDFQPFFVVNYNLGLTTCPTTHPLADYIFHSQLATWQHSAVPWFFGAGGPTDYNVEFENVKRVIDRGQCVILGLKGRPGNKHHQVLCYGYNVNGKKLFIYDPNFPDTECSITATRTGNEYHILITAQNSGAVDSRFEFIFLTLELNPSQTSNRTTYDLLQNAGANFAVRPPAEAFLHQANTANIAGNSTFLDNPYLNGKPNAVILVTPAYANANKHIGVWYDAGRGRWAIFNQDRSPMTNGRSFNVVIPVLQGKTHRAAHTNVSANSTYLDHPFANNNPQALVFVTQRWNSAAANGGYNNRAVGVWFDQGRRRWAVYNEDQSAMGLGLDFNVQVFSAASPANQIITFPDNTATLPPSFTNGAIVSLLTHNYNPNPSNAQYLNAYWEVSFNPGVNGWQMFSTTPLSGKSFNVMKF